MNWQAVIDALRREQVSAANAAMQRRPSPFFDPSKEIERLNLRAELAAMMAGALEAGLAPVAGNGPACHSNGFWAIDKVDHAPLSMTDYVGLVEPTPLTVARSEPNDPTNFNPKHPHSTPALCGTGNPEAGDYAGLIERVQKNG